MSPRRVALVIGLSALATIARAADEEAPKPPTLIAPRDDADQDHCFLPDGRHGIRLDWWSPPGGANGAAAADYLEIRRFDADADQWRPWLKQFANPPFTLNVRPRVYDAVFAWRVWAVERQGNNPAEPSDWWLFCTLPKNGD